MSPLIAYHSTRQCCRESIRQDGLIPDRPTAIQPYAVYVFSDSDDFDHPTVDSRIRWATGPLCDLWEVAYIGPIARDCFVTNGLALLEPVHFVTLVTGNSK